MRKYKDHIIITTLMHDTLMSHKRKTGMGAISIYNYMDKQGYLKQCNTLTIQRIDSWFAKTAKRAIADDFYAVIAAYESINIGNIKDYIPRCGAQRETITPEFLESLHLAFKKRKNFSTKILLKRSDAPPKLTISKLSNILTGRTKTILKSHKAFLEKVIFSE